MYEQVPARTDSHLCFLMEMGECAGRIERGICEGHSTQIFRIAWR